MKRKKLSAGEIRFRTSRQDLERIDWLLEMHPNDYETVSALLRALIAREVGRLESEGLVFTSRFDRRK